MNEHTKAIRDLNDRFRKGDTGIPGRIVITSGVQSLIAEHNAKSVIDVINAVRTFDQFGEANDPWHEHDFGAFGFIGEKLFWKIDCYAPDMASGSQDPADTSKTIRVLTIMLAQEY